MFSQALIYLKISTSAKVKNSWSYTTIPQYAFVA
jgi:hypothetical protein